MTNKSDIIRQALMNYLSPSERAYVMQQMGGMFQALPVMRAAEQPNSSPLPPRKDVIYGKPKRTPRKPKP